LARCVRAALVRRCVLAAAGSVLALGVAGGYTLGATSTNGDVFSVIRGPGNSSLLYTCSSLSGNGCPASHEWTP
jgi:hypothetical protein